MMRVPFERAEDKIDEPGVVALMRALRAGARAEGRPAFVYFMSASPPQIGRAIREKLALDGVEIDGIVFKDQLQHLVRGRFRFLREQVGFKLAELLKARLAAPAGARRVPLRRRLGVGLALSTRSTPTPPPGGSIIRPSATSSSACASIPRGSSRFERSARKIAPVDAVRRIFINLERRTPPGRFRSFGARLVPTFNYFQTALVLHEEGMVPLAAVVAVGSFAASTARRTRAPSSAIPSTISCGAGHLRDDDPALRRDLEESGVLPSTVAQGTWTQRLWRRLRRRRPTPKPLPPKRPVVIDYPRLVDVWLASGGRPGEAAS